MAPDSGIPITAQQESTTRIHQRRRRLLIAVALGVLALLGVLLLTRYHTRAAADSKRRSDASRPIPVRAVAASTGDVDLTVDALGTVAALNTVTVRSRVDGPLIEVPFHEGQLVHGGDLLARIDPRTFQVALDQSAGQLAHDESQLADARIDLARYQGLLAKDSIAKQQVDSQAYTVRQLEGTVKADQAAVENARLQLEFTRITAPFPGRVGLRQIDPGNMIHASDTTGLVVLTQTHPITVILAVPSEQLAQILPRWAQEEPLPVDALDRDGHLLSHGQVSAIDNQIDATTGTVKLKALFANADDALFPSQFVNARLKIQTLSGVTLVPGAAVQRGAPGTFVYVVNSNNTVSLRKISVGPSSGELISVQSGLQPGERVVVDGVDKLRDGGKVSMMAANAGAAPAGARRGGAGQGSAGQTPNASGSGPAARPPGAPARTAPAGARSGT